MTVTSRAAGWPLCQLGRKMSAGRLRVLGIKDGTSFLGAKADGTESAPRRNCEAKPVLQAQVEFLVSQVKAQDTGRDSVQPVTSMSDSRQESQGL